MDDKYNDLEIGTISNIPRNLNKKMRKRKHLDALIKFRSTKTNSTDILRSSEDELFLPYQKPSITKSRSSLSRRCWNYSKHILSFSFICIFIIICIALIYANIQLKHEVENLSLRINEIEQNSTMELNNISSTIKQLKTRLNFLEDFNFLLKNDSTKLQNIEHKTTDELNNLNQKSKIQLENNEKIIQSNNQLNSLRNEIQTELKTQFEQLTNLVHNSSDKTSNILTEFQSDLDKLRSKIDECKCSKESIHSKPSVVNSDQLQQSIVTKPSIINSLTTTTLEKLNKQTENNTDIEQIVNKPSIT